MYYCVAGLFYEKYKDKLNSLRPFLFSNSPCQLQGSTRIWGESFTQVAISLTAENSLFVVVVLHNTMISIYDISVVVLVVLWMLTASVVRTEVAVYVGSSAFITNNFSCAFQQTAVLCKRNSLLWFVVRWDVPELRSRDVPVLGHKSLSCCRNSLSSVINPLRKVTICWVLHQYITVTNAVSYYHYKSF